MPSTQRWKLFHRVFLILTLLWIAYVTIAVPIQMKRRAENELARRLGECTHYSPASGISYDRDCMVQAEGMYVIAKTAASYYFSPEGWPFLLSVCLGIPLLVYGVVHLATKLVGNLLHWRQNLQPGNGAT